MKKINRKFVYSFIIMSFALLIINACKKDDKNNNNPVIPATVIDIDGNVYHTVTIGTQVWMVENLKTTRFRNGDTIPNIIFDSIWANLTTAAYCKYKNNDSMANIYGLLYNWYAVGDIRNIAPLGYHVASDAEWTTLTTYLGGENIAGCKLREADTIHWLSPNIGATDEKGFTALPGSYRYYSGIFQTTGIIGTWWCANDNSSDYAWDRFMQYYVERRGDHKQAGLSVRCVKD